MPIVYANRCDTCGAPYLEGTRTTCKRCIQQKKGRKGRRQRRTRLRCDCGEEAVTVILVEFCHLDGDVSVQRLPLCPSCLEVEQETQALLDELGIPHAPPPGQSRRKPRGKYQPRKKRRKDQEKGTLP